MTSRESTTRRHRINSRAYFGRRRSGIGDPNPFSILENREAVQEFLYPPSTRPRPIARASQAEAEAAAQLAVSQSAAGLPVDDPWAASYAGIQIPENTDWSWDGGIRRRPLLFGRDARHYFPRLPPCCPHTKDVVKKCEACTDEDFRKVIPILLKSEAVRYYKHCRDDLEADECEDSMASELAPPLADVERERLQPKSSSSSASIDLRRQLCVTPEKAGSRTRWTMTPAQHLELQRQNLKTSSLSEDLDFAVIISGVESISCNRGRHVVIDIDETAMQVSTMTEVVQALRSTAVPDSSASFRSQYEPKRASSTTHQGPYVSFKGFVPLAEPQLSDSFNFFTIWEELALEPAGCKIQRWLDATPDSYEESTWAKSGFLGLPAEVRNKIYAEVLAADDGTLKFEIVMPKRRNPEYVTPFDFEKVIKLLGDAYRADHTNLQPTADNTNRLIEQLRTARVRGGMDKEYLFDTTSLTSWQYMHRIGPENVGATHDFKEVFDAWQKEEDKSYKQTQKWPWDFRRNHFAHYKLPMYSGTYCRRLLKTQSEFRLRQELSRISHPAARLELHEKSGDFRGLAALGLTCHVLSVEYLSYLYARTEFSFSDTDAMRLFYSRLRPGGPAQNSLRAIALHRHRTVEPRHRDEAAEFAVQDRDFADACAVAAKQTPHLQKLDVLIDYAEACHNGSNYRYPSIPPIVWDDCYNVDVMEAAPWFAALKAFRQCPQLKQAAVLYQLSPRSYHVNRSFNVPLTAAFGRLLVVGPERLKREYDSGMHDGMLHWVRCATTDLYPMYGPMTEEEAERGPQTPRQFDMPGIRMQRYVRWRTVYGG